jgi:dihydroneopterin aldolase
MDEEAAIGGHYIVDAVIETDFEKAAQHDDLSQTVDYVAVYGIAKREMETRSKLIETVAKRIADALMDEVTRIHKLELRLTKINPPVKGGIEQVSVVIKRERQLKFDI